MIKLIILLAFIIALIIIFAIPDEVEGFCANCGNIRSRRHKSLSNSWYSPYYNYLYYPYYMWDYYQPLPCATDMFGTTRCY
jgi:hypothetical protein